MRFYCLEDNKDFYREVSWGTRVICDVGPHDLGKRFPDEPFWEHCGHCEATWVAREQGMSPRAICPGCKRKLELAYLCHICETFCLSYAEDIDHDKDLTAGAACGACSTDLSSLRWHYCVNLGKRFLSKRDQCPLCDASFFPITARDLLSSMKGHSYQLACISDVDREYLSLVPASIDSPNQIQFFVLGGVQGAIVVPRYTTRSMIEQRARKYQQVFDWSTEWTGDILIERPAIFEFAGKGWRLKKHGKLTGVATEGQEVQPPAPDISEYTARSPSQKPNDHENEHSIEQSGQAVQVEPTSNFVISPNLLNQKASNESKISERTTIALSQVTTQRTAAEPFRAKAKSLYRNFVAGGTVTNNLTYLEFKKSASKEGLRNTAEFLKEGSSQGAFVLFVSDENHGWVFPNPKLTFNAESLKPLFATLTTDEFDNFKEHIEPVPVVRIGKDRWQVEPADKPSADGQAKSAAATRPKAPEPPKSPLVFPASAADCLAKTQSSSKVVRHDVVRNFLVTGPNGKGELSLARNPSLSEKSDSLFVIPRITSFKSADTFHSLYKTYYECSRPSEGEVWIIKPALVSRVQGGWDLREKGVLEIDFVAKRPVPSPKPEIKVQPINAQEEHPTPRAHEEWRLRLVIGIIVSIVLLVAILIGIRTNSSPPVVNRNASPTPSPPTNMVRVLGGEFQMGNNAGDEYEKPVHRVIVKPFLMDIYEVTCEEYLQFVKATSHRVPPNWVRGQYPKGAGRKPVTGVDWYDASAYAQWAKKRLPTEEEWEFAARGAIGRRYAWGNDWTATAANIGSVNSGLVDVGLYPQGKTLEGIMDLIGNAWEWTSTDLTAYPNGRLPSPARAKDKVIRGGSWKEDQTQATTTYRGFLLASGEKDYSATGIRCVQDIGSQH